MALEAPISAEQAVVTHLRGIGMPNMRASYRAVMTEEAWARFLDGLDEDLRRLMTQPVSPQAWIPFEQIFQLRQAFQAFTKHSSSYLRGRMAADSMFHENDSGLMVPKGDLVETLRTLPDLVSFTLKGGLMVLDHLLPGNAAYSLWGIFYYPEYPSEFGLGFFKELMVLQGARQPEVRYLPPERDSYRHRYLFEWDPDEHG